MYPLLPYFLAYSGGVLFAVQGPIGLFFSYILPSVLTGTACWVFIRNKKPRPWQWVALGLVFTIGILSLFRVSPELPKNHIRKNIQAGRLAELTGKLLIPPEVLIDKTRYIVEAETLRYGQVRINITGKVQINVYRPGNTLKVGDRVRFQKVRLKLPRNFKNPGRFDYQRFLARKGINVIGSLSSKGSVESIGYFPLPFLVSKREQIRGKILHAIDTHWPGDEGALLKALLLGDKSSLDETTREAYRNTGMAHLMAVSGLHMGFVATAFFFIGYPVLFYGFYKWYRRGALAGWPPKLIAVMTVFPVLFYLLLVGDKVSALRATIMVLLFLFSILLNRENTVINTMIAAAFLILLWNPASIASLSLQLSFTAVFSILFVVQLLNSAERDPLDKLMPTGKWWQYGKNLFYCNCAAYLSTLPILAYHFNQISVAGWLLNFLMIPVATLLIPLALFVLVVNLAWIGFAGVFAPLISLLVRIIDFGPAKLGNLDFISIHLPTPSPLSLVAYYFLLFAGPCWWVNRRNTALDDPLKKTSWGNIKLFRALTTAGILLMIGLVWPRLPWGFSKPLSVWFLDVGQGESTFIEFPDNTTLLLDGGGFYKNALDVGGKVVAPFLWGQGIRKLDYVVASHSDNDHISGLESILDLFPVKHYLDFGVSQKDDRLRRLRMKAERQGAKVYTLWPGRSFFIGGAILSPIHPDKRYIEDTWKESQTRGGNNLSLVLRIDYQDFGLLMSGDIANEAETHLLESDAGIQAEFLKGPHHGSRFSSTWDFIDKVQPRHVFFSSGYLNPFWHPHQETLSRYRKQGTRIWRTDRNGAIHVATDGFKHQIETHELY